MSVVRSWNYNVENERLIKLNRLNSKTSLIRIWLGSLENVPNSHLVAASSLDITLFESLITNLSVSWFVSSPSLFNTSNCSIVELSMTLIETSPDVWSTWIAFPANSFDSIVKRIAQVNLYVDQRWPVNLVTAEEAHGVEPPVCIQARRCAKHSLRQ